MVVRIVVGICGLIFADLVGFLIGVRNVAVIVAEDLARSPYQAEGVSTNRSTLISPQAAWQLADWNSRLGPVSSFKVEAVMQGEFGIPTWIYVTTKRGSTVHHEVIEGDGICHVSYVKADRDYARGK